MFLFVCWNVFVSLEEHNRRYHQTRKGLVTDEISNHDSIKKGKASFIIESSPSPWFWQGLPYSDCLSPRPKIRPVIMFLPLAPALPPISWCLFIIFHVLVLKNGNNPMSRAWSWLYPTIRLLSNRSDIRDTCMMWISWCCLIQFLSLITKAYE